MTTKYLFLAAAMLLSPLAADAQGNEKGELQSYNYVELQAGGQITFTDVKFDKLNGPCDLLRPTFGLSLGRFFTPVVGARLHVNGYESKSGFDKNNGTYYKWKYITTDADVMFNLSNLIWGNKDRFLNVIFLAGIGLNTAWDNDEAQAVAAADPGLNMPFVWDGTRLSHNIRAGLRLETSPYKKFGVSLEVNMNSLDDRFNSKYNDADDWQMTAMLGVSYRFGHKYKNKPVPEPAPVVEPEPEPEPAPVVVPEPKPEPVVAPEPEKIHKESFYKIREASPFANIAEVAAYMKRNPEAKVAVVGYADKGTGNAKINMKYSQQRADTYKAKLVKEYGIDEKRIITSAKGDTVQPFEENDKNRCVIIDGPVD